MDITAMIPVREGSRRLKNKNVAPFAGTNLLIHKIRQVKRVPDISRIVVSSDSDMMLAMAQSEGVEIHKREQAFADDQSVPFGEVVAHICNNLAGKHLLWATCTSPLVFPEDYTSAIRCYKKALQEGYDSLVSVEYLKRFLWDDKGPINYEFGLKHVLSQDLPPLYTPTNGIFLAPRQDMIDWKYFHGKTPYKYVMDKRKSVDIDDGLDLAIARVWLDMDESVSHIIPYQIDAL